MVSETTSRLEAALRSTKGDLKLVAYIMAGHPSKKRSIDVGKRLAASAKQAGVETVVFDRGGYLYHGRVKALADGAREGGLVF